MPVRKRKEKVHGFEISHYYWPFAKWHHGSKGVKCWLSHKDLALCGNWGTSPPFTGFKGLFRCWKVIHTCCLSLSLSLSLCLSLCVCVSVCVCVCLSVSLSLCRAQISLSIWRLSVCLPPTLSPTLSLSPSVSVCLSRLIVLIIFVCGIIVFICVCSVRTGC